MSDIPTGAPARRGVTDFAERVRVESRVAALSDDVSIPFREASATELKIMELEGVVFLFDHRNDIPRSLTDLVMPRKCFCARCGFDNIISGFNMLTDACREATEAMDKVSEVLALVKYRQRLPRGYRKHLRRMKAHARRTAEP